jgi:hypothetical protein
LFKSLGALTMKLTDLDTSSSREPATLPIDDIISDLFHDAQNGVHLVGMELELVSMGLGNSSDALKTAGIVKQLENNLRDLRGYVSALQHPSATCDAAAVLEAVLGNLQAHKRNNQVNLTSEITESLPTARAHPKLLTRILERVFEFCEDLLHQGGEVGIRAAMRQVASQVYAEIDLTILSSIDIPIIAEEELCRSGTTKRRSQRGIERALEVLRRHRGQTIFRRHSDRRCQLTLRILASPK